MATASDQQLRLTPETAPGKTLEPLIEAIPLPAALISPSGLILAANTCWKEEYPSAKEGTPCVAWCERLHRSEAELRSELFTGLNEVLAGRRDRFVQDGTAGNIRYSIAVSQCQYGAVATVQTLPGAQSPAPPAGDGWHSHKMETVGRLVGGVAHDFANLLTLIAGYSDILLSRMAESDALRPELDEIRNAANRGAWLTGQLLGYSRGQKPQPRTIDLNEIVAGLQRMLRPLIGENISLDMSLSARPVKVIADPGQMEQVIMNLLLNARDAMPKGGRIRIETSEAELTADQAREHGIQGANCVLLSISDEGHGMGSETLGHLFEPFFTTKEAGKGTGIGLSTVREIVKQTGGNITVVSAPGAGARFTLWLPGAAESDGDRDAVAAPLQTRAGHETVLLVEDDESVRHLLAHVLRRQGYEVLEACDGEEALRIFGGRRDAINLLLTDMLMPGLSGRELAERALALRPGLAVIFMSGYTDDVLVRTGALRAGMSFLQKPLRPEVLAAKIREALDSTVQPSPDSNHL